MRSIVSFEEASKLANKSVRTLRNWVERYGMNRTYLKGVPHLQLDELEIVLDNFGQKTLTGPLLSLFTRRLEALQREVDLIKFLHGLQIPKDYHGEDAALVFKLAQQYSLAQPQDQEQANTCLTLLEELSEVTLDQISQTMDQPHPWIPFWYASSKLRDWIYSETKRSKGDRRRRLQEMLHKTNASRERIRALALFYIEMDMSSSTRQTLTALLGSESFIRRVDVVLEEATKSAKEWAPLPTDPVEIVANALNDLTNNRQGKVTIARLLRRAAAILESEKNDQTPE